MGSFRLRYKWFLGGLKNLKVGFQNPQKRSLRVLKKLLREKKIDEETLNELEEILISSDMGVKFSLEVIEDLRKAKIIDPTVKKIKKVIQKIVSLLETLRKKIDKKSKPYICLVVGVNGVGKTATAGKIAHKYFTDGKK